MSKLSHEEIVIFFSKRKDLKIAAIEKAVGLPATTLNRALNSSSPTKLNKEQCALLEPYLRDKCGYRDDAPQKSMYAEIIALINHKGGVAKTTTTINLAKALTLLNKKVLIVDLDPQGSATASLGQLSIDKQVINALLDDTAFPIIAMGDGLFLSPSNTLMGLRKAELSASAGSDNRLRCCLDEIRNQFDFILIDCPPDLEIFSKSALVAANSCIIPFSPEAQTYLGMKSLFKFITDIRKFSNTSLQIKGILFTIVRRSGLNLIRIHKEMMGKVKEEYKHFRIFEQLMEVEVVIAESQVAMQTIFDYAPESASAARYMNLAIEIETSNH